MRRRLDLEIQRSRLGSELHYRQGRGLVGRWRGARTVPGTEDERRIDLNVNRIRLRRWQRPGFGSAVDGLDCVAPGG